MLKILAHVLVLVSVAAVCLRSQESPTTPRIPEISASGVGQVRLVPTLATVFVTVSTRAPTAAEAAAQNAGRTASTRKALRNAGLADAQLSDISYSVGQNYDPRRSEPDGFIARNTIRAEIPRIDDLGRIIDAALAGGATEVGSIQFSSPNNMEARRTALGIAVREARLDAETIAKAAGGSLGRLITLSSGATGPIGYGENRLASGIVTQSASVPTRIAPGELTVTTQAFGRWEFIPGPSR